MFLLDNPHLIIFLLEFALILGASKLLGLFFKKINQPTITADLLIGLMLGPSVLRRLSPTLSSFLFPVDHTQFLMLETIAWTGIFFMLLETGLEVNFASIWRQKQQASIIAVSGILIPLFLCFSAVYLLPDRYLVPDTSKFLFSLFVAITLTISAMPIAIRALYDLNILKSDMGFLIVSALTINDFIGWILFTIVLGIFSSGSANLFYILKFISLTLIFVLGIFFFLRKPINLTLKKIKTQETDSIGLSISFITIIGMIFGAITLAIGLHALLGFFLAGIIVGGSEYLSEKERNVINKMVYSIFVPFFFVIIGLKIDIFKDFNLWLLLYIIIVGVLSKFIGAYTGTLISKNTAKDRVPIAVAHTAGGEMQIVIGMLALESGLISQSIFIAIIGGAVLSTIILGPWLSFALKLRDSLNFISLFRKEYIVESDEINDKDSLLQLMAQKASTILKGDHESIYQSIVKREESMSTAIGNHIAIPHARLEKAKKPIILFARSQQGIEWNSPDGKPVYIIFLIITSNEQSTLQLKILREIVMMFKGKELVQELRQLSDSQDSWRLIKNNLSPSI